MIPAVGRDAMHPSQKWGELLQGRVMVVVVILLLRACQWFSWWTSVFLPGLWLRVLWAIAGRSGRVFLPRVVREVILTWRVMSDRTHGSGSRRGGDNGRGTGGAGAPSGTPAGAGDPAPLVSPRFVARRAAGGGPGPVGAVDPGFSATYPALWEYLSLGVLPDGPRQTSTLLVFLEDGMVKMCLHDRDAGVQLFRSADTFSGALEGLEEALESGRADWRPKKTQGRRA
jgi:hypothetical protein